MSGPLNIRNLTAVPFTVKIVERFQVQRVERAGQRAPEEPAKVGGDGFLHLLQKNVTEVLRNVTTTIDSTPDTIRGPIVDGQASFARDEVDIRIDPFTTNNTSINAKDGGRENEVLRLELEGDGARWSLEIPSPSTATQLLTRIDGHRDRQYSAIFIESCTMVAILDTTSPNTWMSRLNNDTPLSALSIPGTHNSATCYKALPSVRCQVATPRDQLDNGVRFFDVRVKVVNPSDPNSDQLHLVHGDFPITLSGAKEFRPLVNSVLEYLDQNPSETVIMSLKREGRGEATDAQLSLILHDHYLSPASHRWFTEPRIPHLGEARGKIILMRRFALDDRIQQQAHNTHGWGLDAENWQYNTQDCTHGHVRVQDLCEVDDGVPGKNIDTKVDVCCKHFERVNEASPGAGPDGGPLFLNFLSAANFWKTDCWPDKIAARLNPATTAFLCDRHGCEGQGAGAVGVVVCDWVGDRGDWGLVRTIVAMNGRLILKQQQQQQQAQAQ